MTFEMLFVVVLALLGIAGVAMFLHGVNYVVTK